MKPIVYTLLMVIAVSLWAIACISDEVEAQQQAQYCEMTALWERDAARGIPAEDRKGWPDYNENRTEVCNG